MSAAIAATAPSDTPSPVRFRPWVPKRVLVTPGALRWAHGVAIVERAAALGSHIVELAADRLAGLPTAYTDAKATLAVVVASPSRRRLQPIPPSADWRFDLAEGCPAHCQYCYLAGSLSGPPITRAYANLPEILAGLASGLGHGHVTSRSRTRAAEGTTYEASCYTDPLALEHLTHGLATCIEHFGVWDAPVQLRFTTKFDAVEPLLDIRHAGRTRVRFSVNARKVERYEGGTPRVAGRLAALRRVALAGYKVGLTVAPIMPATDWRRDYRELFAAVAAALDGISGLDLTVELITHRFTPGSREVLRGWYPGSALEMDGDQRTRKTTKFGAVKFVYPPAVMAELRGGIEEAVRQFLPGATILYWT